MKDKNCGYCGNETILSDYGIFIKHLKHSDLYLFKEQSHPGRVIVAYKDHINDITDLSDDERNGFFADISLVSKAVKKLYKPAKVNYGMYNDKGTHLHCHIVPKYTDGFEFGDVFQMNPRTKYLSEEEYKKIIEIYDAETKSDN